MIFHKKEKSIILRASSKDLLFMAIKKTTRRSIFLRLASKGRISREKNEVRVQFLSHHLQVFNQLISDRFLIPIIALPRMKIGQMQPSEGAL